MAVSCGADGGVALGTEGVGGDVSEGDCNDSIRRRILPMCPGGTPRVSRVLSNVLSSGSGMLRKSSTSSYPSSLNSAECLARMAPNGFDIGEGPGAFRLNATPSGVGADICRRRQEKMTRGWPCMHTQYPMYASLDEIRCTPLFYMYPCTFCSMNMSYVRRGVRSPPPHTPLV